MTTYKVIAMCCSTIACILSITISKVKEKKRKELAYMTWFVVMVMAFATMGYTYRQCRKTR